ncbi:hypothetical protein PSTT_16194 [Puccinia striiformis]|uniref:Uncharacterized protein n=1 Tax=Puccinia striiformis TaxID=27350 RepID=A0A2S4UE24_9BASI|nr:hypothetical protein PSTT_16194 [Puccinia striiformis]
MTTHFEQSRTGSNKSKCCPRLPRKSEDGDLEKATVTMVFVKYTRDVSVIAVKLSPRGSPLVEINQTIDLHISHDSLSRRNQLYLQTRELVGNPALYADRGHARAFLQDAANFVLSGTVLSVMNRHLTHLQSPKTGVVSFLECTCVMKPGCLTEVKPNACPER